MIEVLEKRGMNTGEAYKVTLTVGDWWCPNCGEIAKEIDMMNLGGARSQCKKCGRLSILTIKPDNFLQTAIWQERGLS